LLPQPNPSTGEALLRLPDDPGAGALLRITDALGREVHRQYTHQRDVVLFSESFPPGIYHLEWNNGNRTEKGRWVVLR
jgi:hypothetical protein